MTALQQRDVDGFYGGLRQVGTLILGAIPLFGLHRIAMDVLKVQWRTALTTRLAAKYLADSGQSHSMFYRLHLAGDIDNPDQRILQDAHDFVGTALELVTNMFGTVFKVVGFSSVLYAMSPSICGGLGAYVIFGTVVSARGFGPRIMRYQQDCRKQEATLRYCLIRVRENAESIAFFRGGGAEWARFKDLFDELLGTIYRGIYLLTGFGVFKQAFNFATFAVAPLAVGPAYLRGEVEFGAISQASLAFSVILSGLTVVMSHTESLSALSAQVSRLDALEQALQREASGDGASGAWGAQGPPASAAPAGAAQRPKGGRIDLVEEDVSETPDASGMDTQDVMRHDRRIVLEFTALTLLTPPPRGPPGGTSQQHQHALIENLSLRLASGESLLIVGLSGIGKSSLLRAVAGLWSSGSGSIARCSARSTSFMPQNPYMFLGTLQEQLLYPHVKEHMTTDGALEDALRQVNLGYLLERYRLHDTEDWSTVLSLGERQRINFARVLLQPGLRLALIDEGTSACDPANEGRLYELLQQRVPSYVSVGHRPCLERYHSHVLNLHWPDSGGGVASAYFSTMAEHQARIDRGSESI